MRLRRLMVSLVDAGDHINNQLHTLDYRFLSRSLHCRIMGGLDD